MVGGFPTHRYEEPNFQKYPACNRNTLFEEADEVSNLTVLNKLLELRIKELESMLETLSPGVTRG